MDIRDMHYDLKQKLNKVDSQKYSNLRIEEIDWKLNEAIEVFIKAIALPRYKKQVQESGYEFNQRTIEDIRTIVVEQFFENENCISVTKVAGNKYKAILPTNYFIYLRGYVAATKKECTKQLRAYTRATGDLHEESAFDVSSFEWRECSIEFHGNEISILTDGTFTPTNFCLTYIRKHAFVHNARDTASTQYYLPDRTTLLTGFQNCELPEITHREIVDLAAMIITGDLQLPDYTMKANKLNISN